MPLSIKEPDVFLMEGAILCTAGNCIIASPDFLITKEETFFFMIDFEAFQKVIPAKDNTGRS